MLQVARAEAERCGVANRLQIVPGFAESLPLDDECADVIVATMLMCSVKVVVTVLHRVSDRIIVHTPSSVEHHERTAKTLAKAG